MTVTISINGVVCAPEAARVSVLDRGFLYGDSVFEVLRTWNGSPFALEEHLGRLYRSATRLGIAMPVPLAQWSDETRVALRAAGQGEWVIRWMLTRGEGPIGLDTARVGAPTRVIVVEPLRDLPKEMYCKGVRVVTLPGEFSLGRGTILGAKTGNYLWNVLATRHARAQGAHEGLFMGESGAVLEGASSNVFAFGDNRLITPRLTDEILPGITRALVIESARSLAMKCEEVAMTETDLWTADEVFLTSSVREIVPVTGVNDHEVGDGLPGPITRKIHARFRQMAGARTPLPWE